MTFQEDFSRALRDTEIHRQRRSRLLTVGATELKYVLLGASLVNLGDTVVRSGIVRVEKPALVLLRPSWTAEGFEESDEEAGQALVALGRSASFPPGKYSNIDAHLDVFEGGLPTALAHFGDRLDAMEDVHTGLLSGPVDLWPLSVLIYVGAMVARSSPEDLNEMMGNLLPPPHWS